MVVVVVLVVVVELVVVIVVVDVTIGTVLLVVGVGRVVTVPVVVVVEVDGAKGLSPQPARNLLAEKLNTAITIKMARTNRFFIPPSFINNL